MKRKDFLKIAAAGAAVGLGQLVISACKSSSTPTTPTTPGTSKTFTSTTVSGHAHTVDIARTEIDSPPAAGISRETSVASGHTHTFAMTQAQLTTVSGGGSVTVTTSATSSHTHDFTISKWYAAGKSILNF